MTMNPWMRRSVVTGLAVGGFLVLGVGTAHAEDGADDPSPVQSLPETVTTLLGADGILGELGSDRSTPASTRPTHGTPAVSETNAEVKVAEADPVSLPEPATLPEPEQTYTIQPVGLTTDGGAHPEGTTSDADLAATSGAAPDPLASTTGHGPAPVADSSSEATPTTNAAADCKCNLTMGTPAVNGTPAGAPGSALVSAGEPATVAVPVSNTGDVTVTNLTVSGPGGAMTCGRTTLAVDASTTCSGSYSPSAGGQSAPIRAVGSTPDGGRVSSSALLFVTGLTGGAGSPGNPGNPGGGSPDKGCDCDLTSGTPTVGGNAAGGPGNVRVPEGSTTTVSIPVYNSGDRTVSNLSATSPDGRLTCADAELAPTESTACSGPVQVEAGNQSVPITVSGKTPDGERTSADGIAYITGIPAGDDHPDDGDDGDDDGDDHGSDDTDGTVKVGGVTYPVTDGTVTINGVKYPVRNNTVTIGGVTYPVTPTDNGDGDGDDDNGSDDDHGSDDGDTDGTVKIGGVTYPVTDGTVTIGGVTYPVRNNTVTIGGVTYPVTPTDNGDGDDDDDDNGSDDDHGSDDGDTDGTVKIGGVTYPVTDGTVTINGVKYPVRNNTVTIGGVSYPVTPTDNGDGDDDHGSDDGDTDGTVKIGGVTYPVTDGTVTINGVKYPVRNNTVTIGGVTYPVTPTDNGDGDDDHGSDDGDTDGTVKIGGVTYPVTDGTVTINGVKYPVRNNTVTIGGVTYPVTPTDNDQVDGTVKVGGVTYPVTDGTVTIGGVTYPVRNNTVTIGGVSYPVTPTDNGGSDDGDTDGTVKIGGVTYPVTDGTVTINGVAYPVRNNTVTIGGVTYPVTPTDDTDGSGGPDGHGSDGSGDGSDDSRPLAISAPTVDGKSADHHGLVSTKANKPARVAFSVTNTSDVEVTGLSGQVGSADIRCSDTELAPGESATCTARVVPRVGAQATPIQASAATADGGRTTTRRTLRLTGVSAGAPGPGTGHAPGHGGSSGGMTGGVQSTGHTGAATGHGTSTGAAHGGIVIGGVPAPSGMPQHGDHSTGAFPMPRGGVEAGGGGTATDGPVVGSGQDDEGNGLVWLLLLVGAGAVTALRVRAHHSR